MLSNAVPCGHDHVQFSLVTLSGLCQLGHLNHAAMVVRSGRSFLRRMIDCLSLASRPDHFICLNREFQSDLRWWHIFVSRWNGISFIASVAPSITVTSDASGTWGYGAFVRNQWFQLAWPPSWSDIHITAKELVPIVLAAMIWGSTWSKKVVQFICCVMLEVWLFTESIGYAAPTLF